MFKELLIRLVIAVIIGALIGWEREMSKQPAGFRTHILVTLGAAIVTMVGYFTAYNFAGSVNVDPNRLAAQVINGVGFLGAGTIMKEGVTVRGLTTAAGIWTSACLGIAVGAGYYNLAVIGVSSVIVILVLFRILRKRIIKGRYPRYRVEVVCKNITRVLNLFNQKLSETEGKFENMTAKEEGENRVKVTFYIQFFQSDGRMKMDEIMEELSLIKGIEGINLERIK